MVCLDTDVMVHFLRGEETIVQQITHLKDENERLTTTAVNSFELWKGVYRSAQKNALDAVEQFLKEIEILYLDTPASKKAAKIFESLSSKGEIIDVLDIFIASIAITHHEPLLTHNKKHFKRITELQLL